jgi:hypothetical protein
MAGGGCDFPAVLGIGTGQLSERSCADRINRVLARRRNAICINLWRRNNGMPSHMAAPLKHLKSAGRQRTQNRAVIIFYLLLTVY